VSLLHEVYSLSGTTEGSPVALTCTYETKSSNIYLYWYKQYANQEPQYLLYKGAGTNRDEQSSSKRYKCLTSQTSTTLEIKQVTLADTALYYCALKDAQ
uniref:Ig-like domain-containing protein n=1 Tax=Esox lucius TaxID=8010 RepID=A0A6Q2WVL4_ESOLU